LVYNTNATLSGGTGIYYNSGSPASPSWTRLQNATGSGDAWLITGNSGTNASIHFIGTTNNVPLVFKTNNIQSGRIDPVLRNYFIGENAGANNISTNNVAIGHAALRFNTRAGLVAVGDSALYANSSGATSITHGTLNTAIGSRALRSNTTGSYNTALGARALLNNTTGRYNTAAGYDALNNNTIGEFNTAFGASTLTANTTGSNNTAFGYITLNGNTSGSNNTAIGVGAMQTGNGNNNTAIGSGALNLAGGVDNTAIGYNAARQKGVGERNTAIGTEAMEGLTGGVGNDNVAIGYRALRNRGTGSSNVAIGVEALRDATGSGNVVIGRGVASSFTTGSNNTLVGSGISITPGTVSNSTAIGFGASITASNQIRFGNTAVTSIGGQPEWTALSDERAKSEIKELAPGLSFIMGLRPVSYYLHTAPVGGQQAQHIKGNRIDEKRHIGFVAQEVEQLVQKLGVEFDGVDKPENPQGTYGLRYGLFVVPLIKAVQEQQMQIEALLQKAQSLQIQVEQALHAKKTTANQP
ncbi:MAG TPA: tail fiber domain-containing protein, partial [Phnomibacter sp.]|nr:tail fiber domain-containing protein [Phnomibacter sp.]